MDDDGRKGLEVGLRESVARVGWRARTNWPLPVLLSVVLLAAALLADSFAPASSSPAQICAPR